LIVSFKFALFALIYNEDKINNRPRKVLNYKTPYEVYYNKKVALVS